jgi:PilZ domain
LGFCRHRQFTLTRHFAGRGLSHAGKPGMVFLFIGRYSMLDRRESVRDKVIYGGVAEIGERGATRDCVVRNISDKGASIEFSNVIKLPKEKIALTIARKGRSFLARVVWWRDNFVGVAFSSEKPYDLPVSDLEERLRKSELKKRQLQRRIKELIG